VTHRKLNLSLASQRHRRSSVGKSEDIQPGSSPSVCRSPKNLAFESVRGDPGFFCDPSFWQCRKCPGRRRGSSRSCQRHSYGQPSEVAWASRPDQPRTSLPSLRPTDAMVGHSAGGHFWRAIANRAKRTEASTFCGDVRRPTRKTLVPVFRSFRKQPNRRQAIFEDEKDVLPDRENQ
jgi:hypothetical protein